MVIIITSIYTIPAGKLIPQMDSNLLSFFNEVYDINYACFLQLIALPITKLQNTISILYYQYNDKYKPLEFIISNWNFLELSMAQNSKLSVCYAMTHCT